MQKNRRPMRPRRDNNLKVRRTVRTREEVEAVKPGDKESLDKFVTMHGKILPQRITGVSAKQQRMIKRTVKQARNSGVV